MYGPAAGAAAGNQAGRVRHKLDDFQKPWTKISKGSYGTVYRVVRVGAVVTSAPGLGVFRSGADHGLILRKRTRCAQQPTVGSSLSRR